ncbi:hypothetical protein [Polaromonas sp. CG9_12]|nr:hypothetical protein [Polaromonas sp. CG9_12]
MKARHGLLGGRQAHGGPDDGGGRPEAARLTALAADPQAKDRPDFERKALIA